MARRPSRPTEPDRSEKLLDAALALASERDWPAIGMADIAAQAGLSLAEARAAFPDKPCMVAALLGRMDAAMLADAGPADAESTPHDRLFDLLMRRFDALALHKTAIARMARTLPRDPVSGLVAAPSLLRSMAWALEAAGVSTGGLRGILRMKALAGLYLMTMRTWLRDETPDQAETMASLDRNLKRMGRFLGI